MALKVDPAVLLRRTRAMREAAPMARREGALLLAQDLVRELAAISHKDTNRYVRGWVLAGQGAGVVGVYLPALRPSDRREEYIRRLERQLARFEAKADELKRAKDWLYNRPRATVTGRRRPRPRPGLRRMEREIARFEKLAVRASEELEKALGSEAFIAIGGHRRKSGKAGLTITVRDKVYGGTGSITDTAEATILILHNKEAHARILEKRYGTLKRAEAVAKQLGLRRAGAKYVQRLKVAAGLAA